MGEKPEQATTSEAAEYRGLGHDMILVATGAVVGGVVQPVATQVTGHLLGGQKPQEDEGPKVILPPGAGRDD